MSNDHDLHHMEPPEQPEAPQAAENPYSGYADLRRMYETDDNAEKTGIEVQFGPKTFIKLARAGGANKAFQKAAEREFRPHRQAIERGVIDIDMTNDLLKKVYAETIVLGWRGVLDPKTITYGADGEPDFSQAKELPFSKENALYLFRELPELFNDLKEQAENAANFRHEQVKADAGN